jgi:hypothetical protein
MPMSNINKLLYTATIGMYICTGRIRIPAYIVYIFHGDRPSWSYFGEDYKWS